MSPLGGVADEYRKEWKERLANYQRLVEVSRRAIEIKEQNIKNYQAKISILRESLRNLNAQADAEAE